MLSRNKMSKELVLETQMWEKHNDKFLQKAENLTNFI